MITHSINFEQMSFGLLRKLAASLKISFPELIQIEPAMTPFFNHANIIKYYSISFAGNADKSILNKIRILTPDQKVYMGYYVINELLPVLAPLE